MNRREFVEAEMKQLRLGDEEKTPEQLAKEAEETRKRIAKHDEFWGVKWGSTITAGTPEDRDD